MARDTITTDRNIRTPKIILIRRAFGHKLKITRRQSTPSSRQSHCKPSMVMSASSLSGGSMHALKRQPAASSNFSNVTPRDWHCSRMSRTNSAGGNRRLGKITAKQLDGDGCQEPDKSSALLSANNIIRKLVINGSQYPKCRRMTKNSEKPVQHLRARKSCTLSKLPEARSWRPGNAHNA